MKAIAIATICVLLFPHNTHAETSTLRMRFVIDRFIPDDKTHGAESFVVYVFTGRGGTKHNLPRRNPEEHTLRIGDTVFQPVIVTAQVGDSLKLMNQGKRQCVLTLNGLNFPPLNASLQPTETRQVPLGPVAPQTILVESFNRPGSVGYIFLFDHPFAGVADEDGVVTIAELPSNVDLTFRAWHPDLRPERVQIDGTPTIWRRSSFDLNLQPGLNDIGDILLAFEATQ